LKKPYTELKIKSTAFKPTKVKLSTLSCNEESAEPEMKHQLKIGYCRNRDKPQLRGPGGVSMDKEWNDDYLRKTEKSMRKSMALYIFVGHDSQIKPENLSGGYEV
jgi:hypothetical protein